MSILQLTVFAAGKHFRAPEGRCPAQTPIRAVPELIHSAVPPTTTCIMELMPDIGNAIAHTTIIRSAEALPLLVVWWHFQISGLQT